MYSISNKIVTNWIKLTNHPIPKPRDQTLKIKFIIDPGEQIRGTQRQLK